MVIEAGELAKAEGIGHSPRHATTVIRKAIWRPSSRIHDGAIGGNPLAPLLLERRRNPGDRPQPAMSDLEWQIRQLNIFHLAFGAITMWNKHVHNSDIMPLGAWNASDQGRLGHRPDARCAPIRSTATSSTIFRRRVWYPNGVRMVSQARQINNCDRLVARIWWERWYEATAASIIKPKSG